jgi:hypothetical protein
MNYCITYTDAAGDVRQAVITADNPLLAFDRLLAEKRPRDRTKVCLCDERGACLYMRALGPHTSKPEPKPKLKAKVAPAPVVELKQVARPRPRRTNPRGAKRTFEPRTTPFAPPRAGDTQDQLDAFLASLTKEG